MKIPYEEAERRLVLQYKMNEVEIKIAEAEPTYAGSGRSMSRRLVLS